MIPDEAVEAARTVILPYVDDDHFDLSAVARLALEAAAPHLMAGAWEAGMEAMYEATSHEWPPIPEQNPYRKPTNAV